MSPYVFVYVYFFLCFLFAFFFFFFFFWLVVGSKYYIWKGIVACFSGLGIIYKRWRVSESSCCQVLNFTPGREWWFLHVHAEHSIEGRAEKGDESGSYQNVAKTASAIQFGFFFQGGWSFFVDSQAS